MEKPVKNNRGDPLFSLFFFFFYCLFTTKFIPARSYIYPFNFWFLFVLVFFRSRLFSSYSLLVWE